MIGFPFRLGRLIYFARFVNRETDGCFGGFAFTECAAVIEGGQGGEANSTCGYVDNDSGGGMGAKTDGVFLAVDHEGAATGALVILKLLPGLFGADDMFFLYGNALSILIDEGWFDPVGPVVIFVTKVTDVELNLFETFDCGIDVVDALLTRSSDFGALKK